MKKRSTSLSNTIIEQTTKLDKEEHMIWTDPLISKLIDHYSCVLFESTSDSNIKSTEWTKVLINFNNDTKLNCTRQQLQSKIQSLKKQWTAFKKMKENSGWVWDDLANIPICDDEVWDSYVAIHKDAKQFRKDGVFIPFIWFEDCENMFSASTATGQYTRAFNTIESEGTKNLMQNINGSLGQHSDSDSDDTIDNDTIKNNENTQSDFTSYGNKNNNTNTSLILSTRSSNSTPISTYNSNDNDSISSYNRSSNQIDDNNNITPSQSSISNASKINTGRPPLPLKRNVNTNLQQNLVTKKHKNGTYALAESINNYSKAIVDNNNNNLYNVNSGNYALMSLNKLTNLYETVDYFIRLEAIQKLELRKDVMKDGNNLLFLSLSEDECIEYAKQLFQSLDM